MPFECLLEDESISELYDCLVPFISMNIWGWTACRDLLYDEGQKLSPDPRCRGHVVVCNSLPMSPRHWWTCANALSWNSNREWGEVSVEVGGSRWWWRQRSSTPPWRWVGTYLFRSNQWGKSWRPCLGKFQICRICLLMETMDTSILDYGHWNLHKGWRRNCWLQQICVLI